MDLVSLPLGQMKGKQSTKCLNFNVAVAATTHNYSFWCSLRIYMLPHIGGDLRHWPVLWLCFLKQRMKSYHGHPVYKQDGGLGLPVLCHTSKSSTSLQPLIWFKSYIFHLESWRSKNKEKSKLTLSKIVTCFWSCWPETNLNFASYFSFLSQCSSYYITLFYYKMLADVTSKCAPYWVFWSLRN